MNIKYGPSLFVHAYIVGQKPKFVLLFCYGKNLLLCMDLLFLYRARLKRLHARSYSTV